MAPGPVIEIITLVHEPWVRGEWSLARFFSLFIIILGTALVDRHVLIYGGVSLPRPGAGLVSYGCGVCVGFAALGSTRSDVALVACRASLPRSP